MRKKLLQDAVQLGLIKEAGIADILQSAAEELKHQLPQGTHAITKPIAQLFPSWGPAVNVLADRAKRYISNVVEPYAYTPKGKYIKPTARKIWRSGVLDQPDIRMTVHGTRARHQLLRAGMGLPTRSRYRELVQTPEGHYQYPAGTQLKDWIRNWEFPKEIGQSKKTWASLPGDVNVEKVAPKTFRTRDVWDFALDPQERLKLKSTTIDSEEKNMLRIRDLAEKYLLDSSPAVFQQDFQIRPAKQTHPAYVPRVDTVPDVQKSAGIFDRNNKPPSITPGTGFGAWNDSLRRSASEMLGPDWIPGAAMAAGNLQKNTIWGALGLGLEVAGRGAHGITGESGKYPLAQGTAEAFATMGSKARRGAWNQFLKDLRIDRLMKNKPGPGLDELQSDITDLTTRMGEELIGGKLGTQIGRGVGSFFPFLGNTAAESATALGLARSLPFMNNKATWGPWLKGLAAEGTMTRPGIGWQPTLGAINAGVHKLFNPSSSFYDNFRANTPGIFGIPKQSAVAGGFDATGPRVTSGGKLPGAEVAPPTPPLPDLASAPPAGGLDAGGAAEPAAQPATPPPAQPEPVAGPVVDPAAAAPMTADPAMADQAVTDAVGANQPQPDSPFTPEQQAKFDSGGQDGPNDPDRAQRQQRNQQVDQEIQGMIDAGMDPATATPEQRQATQTRLTDAATDWGATRNPNATPQEQQAEVQAAEQRLAAGQETEQDVAEAQTNFANEPNVNPQAPDFMQKFTQAWGGLGGMQKFGLMIGIPLAIAGFASAMFKGSTIGGLMGIVGTMMAGFGGMGMFGQQQPAQTPEQQQQAAAQAAAANNPNVMHDPATIEANMAKSKELYGQPHTGGAPVDPAEGVKNMFRPGPGELDAELSGQGGTAWGQKMDSNLDMLVGMLDAQAMQGEGGAEWDAALKPLLDKVNAGLQGVVDSKIENDTTWKGWLARNDPTGMARSYGINSKLQLALKRFPQLQKLQQRYPDLLKFSQDQLSRLAAA
jgi:hypothetical protein